MIKTHLKQKYDKGSKRLADYSKEEWDDWWAASEQEMIPILASWDAEENPEPKTTQPVPDLDALEEPEPEQRSGSYWLPIFFA